MNGDAQQTVCDEYVAMGNEFVEEHLDYLRASDTSDETIRSRRNALRVLHKFSPMGLLGANRDTIITWMADLRKRGLSQATRAIYGYHICAFYDWFCAEYEWFATNPCDGIDFPKRPRGLPRPATEEELGLLLALPEPILTVVVLGAFGGGRRAEIAAARREHVTPETWLIPRGKGGISRVVPTHPYLWEHVKDRPAGPLVRTRNGDPVTPLWITQTSRRWFNRVGLQHVSPHRLRHRYGTMIQRLYKDIRVTQKALGHKHLTSTEGYTDVAPESVAEGVQALPVPRPPVGLESPGLFAPGPGPHAA